MVVVYGNQNPQTTNTQPFCPGHLPRLDEVIFSCLLGAFGKARQWQEAIQLMMLGMDELDPLRKLGTGLRAVAKESWLMWFQMLNHIVSIVFFLTSARGFPRYYEKLCVQ
jgi:pentatricopeptide repeat protein